MVKPIFAQPITLIVWLLSLWLWCCEGAKEKTITSFSPGVSAEGGGVLVATGAGSGRREAVSADWWCRHSFQSCGPRGTTVWGHCARGERTWGVKVTSQLGSLGTVQAVKFIFISNSMAGIQTHKRFKRTLFIRTKHSMQIFGLIPFIKLQNDT